jgi:hypothetical protein
MMRSKIFFQERLFRKAALQQPLVTSKSEADKSCRRYLAGRPGSKRRGADAESGRSKHGDIILRNGSPIGRLSSNRWADKHPRRSSITLNPTIERSTCRALFGFCLYKEAYESGCNIFEGNEKQPQNCIQLKMSGATFSDITSFLRSQLTFRPPVPTSTFEGQTIIITGANTGLGREAAKHIVRLGAKLVILAVRDLCKGQAASEYIATQTGTADVIQVWQLDLSSFTSVQDFARRAKALTRLDAVVENAGMWPTQFESFEGHE